MLPEHYESDVSSVSLEHLPKLIVAVIWHLLGFGNFGKSVFPDCITDSDMNDQ